MMAKHQCWAEQQFGKANLGDPTRTKRLVKLAERLAREPGRALVNVTQFPADMEGAYRFISSGYVDAQAIAEVGFYATAEQSRWARDFNTIGKRELHASTPYKE